MSISKKIYGYMLKVRDITLRKNFKIVFLTITGIIFFFGVMNIYAYGTEETLQPGWSETKEVHNTASGADAEEDNMNSREGTELLNSAWAWVTLAVPEATEAASLRDRTDIPYDLRRGLLGMTEDTVNRAYAMYPLVNVPEHLAQQWVPGYKESSIATYAADDTSGYEELKSSGISVLWTKTLNIAYVFFVLVMIVAGFMIMFRHKLGGQTVVTLGNVLPKVIVSLILATFSFAIAGIIIDIGGLINGILASLVSKDGTVAAIYGVDQLMNGVIGGDGTVWGAAKALAGTFGTYALFEPKSTLGIIKALTTIFNRQVAVVSGFWTFILMLVGVGIIFIGAIRLVFVLFKAYFGILLTVILGPIQLALGAIPGNAHMIKNWFFAVLRNVMVFPAVFFIVNIPNFLSQGGDITMRLPQRLVYQDDDYSRLTTQFDAERVFITILRLAVLYYAAQAPKFLEAVFPPSTPKAFAEGMAGGRATMAKIPLVGRVFRQK